MEFSNTDYLKSIKNKMKTKLVIQLIMVFSLLPLIGLLTRMTNLNNFPILSLLTFFLFFLFFSSSFYVMRNYSCYSEISFAYKEAEKLLTNENGISKDILDKCLDIMLEEYDEIQKFKENLDIKNLKKIAQIRSNLTREIDEEHKYHPEIVTFLNRVKRHLFRAFDTKSSFSLKNIHFYNWRFNSDLAKKESENF
ncbi:hypothetical protein [Bacillus safensis]|uniref:hypothetical protein n=1 Tax=Bacillus safensis TaxID=561879 RepID=UPI002E1D05F0|nr:hypothetical protein [Bacillus safensis]